MNRQHKIYSAVALGALMGGGIGIGGLALPAQANEAEDGAGTTLLLEEITVTAQKRSQNLQDVGIAVSAFSGDQLKSLGMVDTADIAAHTPGLLFTQPGGSQLIGLPAIRGVSQNDFAPHQETPNALYVDEAYVSFVAGNSQYMFDVERVEVLKGPQGTLFGRNATGGLIHVISRKPGEELEGYADLTVGSFDQIRLESAIGGALSETTAFRAAGFYNTHDGYVKNSIGRDNYEDDTIAGRLQLQVQPSEDLEILLIGSGNKTDDIVVGGGQFTGAGKDDDGLGITISGQPSLFGYLDTDGDNHKGAYDIDGRMNKESYTLTGKLTYDFGLYTLTAISSYTDFEFDYFEDNDLTPDPISMFSMDQKSEQFSQELRINGAHEKLKWVAGAYYLSIESDNTSSFDLLAFGADQNNVFALSTTSWALFGQVEYDLSSELTVIGGFRWSEEDKDYTFSSACVDNVPTLVPVGCAGAFPALAGTINDIGTFNGKIDKGDWSGKAEIDWRPHEDLLVYASVTRGTKAGGFNAPLDGLLTAEQMAFDSEILTSYEMGIKSTFWDGRARFNAAAFYYDYGNYQSFDMRGFTQVIANSDAEIYGLDAEVVVQPGYGLSLMAGLSLLDATVKDTPLPSGRLTDTEPPQAPSFSANGLIAKDWDMTTGLIRAQFDFSYVGDYQVGVANAEVTAIDSYFLGNARISYVDGEDRFEIALFAKNVFNNDIRVYAYDISNLGFGENVYLPPRWFGGQFIVRF
ncbi:TonB-dependent receptor [Luteithermobacter gelatinilyticus]|uniref:TonB-dependent receptor n=1 Tax=Luteithermobacter gelatinilyticus TaxID=2582913 RepID=UPI001106A9E4|nr:TonB-dependent receptor [Luteithermobacter gelatinilyticus]